MTKKRELVLKAFKGEKVDRVPIGFWHHFATDEELLHGIENPEIIQKNIQGHKDFVEKLNPDFVKIMSDGYFTYPNPIINETVKSVKNLSDIETIGSDNSWYDFQVDLVKQVRENFVEDIVSVYNIFSPLTHLKWQLAGEVSEGDDIVAKFLKEDPKLFERILNVIAEDIVVLAKRVVAEGGADGIYYSVQNIQADGVTSEDYQKYVKNSDLIVLNAVNEVSDNNILHICGYEGAKNNVESFKDYPAQVINWAVGPEGISLRKGQEIFQGKTVLGGFENTNQGLLYTGTKEEIQNEVKRLLEENGTDGIIIGADCTIPRDTNLERIEWVREVLAN